MLSLDVEQPAKLPFARCTCVSAVPAGKLQGLDQIVVSDAGQAVRRNQQPVAAPAAWRWPDPAVAATPRPPPAATCLGRVRGGSVSPPLGGAARQQASRVASRTKVCCDDPVNPGRDATLRRGSTAARDRPAGTPPAPAPRPVTGRYRPVNQRVDLGLVAVDQLLECPFVAAAPRSPARGRFPSAQRIRARRRIPPLRTGFVKQSVNGHPV